LQDILTANDPDSLVVDFDRVDYRADVALPCVGIPVVELVGKLDAAPSSEAYDLFLESYRLEEQNGQDHRVIGDIWCGAGSVAEILERVFHQKAQAPSLR
jgi:hypothetical protein